MKQRKWIGAACLAAAALLIVGTMVWRSRRNQPNSAHTFTIAEYDAYTAAYAETNPTKKVKLLEEFVDRYPKSALLFSVLEDAYRANYAQKNYPKTVQYADKFVALYKNDQSTRLGALEALEYRASAFLCDDSAFPTTKADAEARDAAMQALQIVGQLPKSQLTDKQFAAMQNNMSIPFDTVMRVAKSGLKGDKREACEALPPLPGPAWTRQPPDHSRLNRILSEIDK